MKISIITATIDPDPRLAATIESVRTQTWDDVEHIIVDGLDASRRQMEIDAVRYERKPKGVYDALNFGISKATGDIIGLIHGGDRLASPDILARVAEAFEADPSLDFVYGDIRFFNPATGRPGRVYHASRFRPTNLAYGMAPPHPSLYMRREAAKRIGPYREDFRLAADLDLWMRLFADKSLKGLYMPEIFAEMSTGGASSKLSNRLVANNREKLKALRINGYSANPFKLLAKYAIILRDAIFSPRKHEK